jgi:hypothetical protein
MHRAAELARGASVCGLQAQDYTPSQMEGALTTVFGVDTQLIADGTYLVARSRRTPQPAETFTLGPFQSPSVALPRFTRKQQHHADASRNPFPHVY